MIPWKIVNTIKIQSLPYHLTQRKKKLNQKEALSRRTELSIQKAQWLSGQDVDILEAEVTACEMRTDLIEHSRWDSTQWVSMCTSENSRHISTHAELLCAVAIKLTLSSKNNLHAQVFSVWRLSRLRSRKDHSLELNHYTRQAQSHANNTVKPHLERQFRSKQYAVFLKFMNSMLNR